MKQEKPLIDKVAWFTKKGAKKRTAKGAKTWRAWRNLSVLVVKKQEKPLKRKGKKREGRKNLASLAKP